MNNVHKEIANTDNTSSHRREDVDTGLKTLLEYLRSRAFVMNIALR